MARSGHSTNLTSGRHRARQPQTQKLTDDEITELKNYLPEWTAAQRSEKRAVFAAIARAARLFAPKLDQRQWKKRKQVNALFIASKNQILISQSMLRCTRLGCSTTRRRRKGRT
jgi:hypothetical protein